MVKFVELFKQLYTKAYRTDKSMAAVLFQNRIEVFKWEYSQNLIQKGPLNRNMH